jgi:hypothetical protein
VLENIPEEFSQKFDPFSPNFGHVGSPITDSGFHNSKVDDSFFMNRLGYGKGFLKEL